MSEPRSTAQNPRLQPRRIGLIVLGAVVAGVLALLAVILLGPDEAPVSGFTSVEEQPLFSGLDARLDEVETIEIASSTQGVTLRREDSGWVLAQEHGYPVQDKRVEDLLQNLAALRADYASGADSSPFLESGVEDPDEPSSQAVRVRLLSMNDEVLADAILGHSFTVPGARAETKMFVRRNQDERVWLAEPVLRVEASPRGWLDRGVIDVPRRDVVEVAARSPTGKRVLIHQSEKREAILAEGPADSVDAGEPLLAAALGGLEKVEFLEVRPADGVAEKARAAGETVVTTNKGLVYTVRFWSLEGQDWATFSADTAGKPSGNGQSGSADLAGRAKQFDATHEGWAYRLPLHVVARLQVRPEDLTDEPRTDGGTEGGSGEAAGTSPDADSGGKLAPK